MKTLRWCLLLLLSLALPLQVAAAASLGGCMRQAGNRPAQTVTAPAAGHQAAAPMGRMAAAAQSDPPERAAQAHPAAPAPAAATDGSDCAQHHPAPSSVPSVDHSCTSCSWCSLGTALPSHWQGWVAIQVQQVHTVAPVPAYGAPLLRAPERPPRA